MSSEIRAGKTPAELQIENLKRLKQLQSQEPKPRQAPPIKPMPISSPSLSPAFVKPIALVAAPPPISSGNLVTELFDADDEPQKPGKHSKNTPKSKPTRQGSKVILDTQRYRRLKAKWKIEKRFKTERQYWDWALDLLLSTPSGSATLVQRQTEALIKLKTLHQA